MHKLPDLPYGHNALEPYIDAKTMELHHGKHHAGYVNKLNAALENYPELAAKPLEKLLRDLDSVPENIRAAVRNNGGGHYNHSLFWNIMSPSGGGKPAGDLAGAIDKDFGDFEEFKKKFSAAALNIFGSGWAWLTLEAGKPEAENWKLKVITTPNQDTPLSQGFRPILGLDVWEHAFYLKYQNRRADYIKNWWNIVNWKEAGRLVNLIQDEQNRTAKKNPR